MYCHVNKCVRLRDLFHAMFLDFKDFWIEAKILAADHKLLPIISVGSIDGLDIGYFHWNFGNFGLFVVSREHFVVEL